MNHATTIGLELVESAAKYACDMATLGGLFVAAYAGAIPPMQDPERFVDDVMRATWGVMRHAGDDRGSAAPARQSHP